MEKNIVNAVGEKESALDALKLFFAAICLIFLAYFALATWNGANDKIALIITLSTATPLALIVFGTIMAISTKSVAHLELTLKIIRLLMLIWCFIFIIIACIFFYFGAIFYSDKDMMAVIEIDLLSDLTLETKRWALFGASVIFVLFASAASLTPRLVCYLWLNPLSRKLMGQNGS